MPSLILSVLAAVVLPLLAVHLVAVAFTHALRSYSASRLEERCERRGRPDRALRIQQLDEKTERSTEVLAVLTGLCLAALLGALLGRSGPGISLDGLIAVVLGVCAILHLVAGALGRVHAELLLDEGWPLAEAIRVVMTPLTFLTGKIEALFYRRDPRGRSQHPRPPSVEVELHTHANAESAPVGADLPDATREILASAISLATRDAAAVMTPRAGMITVQASSSVREAVRVFIDSGNSRIPVYGENRDDIVGILYAKDLFPLLIEPDDKLDLPVRKLVRPALFVPDTKNATDLLEELRKLRVQMAIVLDEYGSVAGLVTLEDLLEHIVGLIDDEHDRAPEKKPLVHLGGTLYEVDGSLSLEELNEALDLQLPTDGDFLTVGGLAQGSLGRVPAGGSRFTVGGVEFTVLGMAGHTVRRLLLKPAGSTEPAAGS